MLSVSIAGAGIAGQVLHRELTLGGIPSRLVDTEAFPREKVCGGALQGDSWEYLNSIFKISTKAKTLSSINHFWKGKRISRIRLEVPMVYVSRFVLDDVFYSQQKPLEVDPKESIHVIATGVQRQRTKGEWAGFQSPIEPVEELEMHYGKGIYLGITPTFENQSHAAFLVKKSLFRSLDELRLLIKKELGLTVRGPLKGTRIIDYEAPSSEELAIGDAKLVTHPFLGLGMKHAILSARLMAKLISEDRVKDYSSVHRRLFRKYRLASLMAGKIYESPLHFMARPLLSNPGIFQSAYRWLHHSRVAARLESC